MNIRPIEHRDNAKVASVIRAAFEEFGAPKQHTVYSDASTDSLYEFFQHEKSALWVAEENGEVVGSCGVYPTEGLPDGWGEIVKFYLAKSSRGKGIGKSLMLKSIESAHNLGYKTLYIESFPEFKKAVGMYESLGFRSIDHQMGNSGHTATSIWMIRDV